MTVSLVVSQIAAAQNDAGTTITGTWPATPTQNDLLVAAISTNDGSFTNPTGFTTAVEYDEPLADDMQRITYKIAGAGESTTVQATAFGGNAKFITLLEYSGVDTASPLDQVVTRTRQDGVLNSTIGPTAGLANADSAVVANLYIRDCSSPTGFAATNSYTIRSTMTSSLLTPSAVVAELVTASAAATSTQISWSSPVGNAGGTMAVFKGAATAAIRAPMPHYRKQFLYT